LESVMRKAIYEFGLFDGVTKLGIALSGGKDSLTMLFLLKAIIGHGVPNMDLVGLHVEGTVSCGAGVGSPFLVDYCQQLEVPLITRHTETAPETLECYSCSRRRRRLLFDMAKEEGCTTIAFGHHRDDNAQTTLMNLLHKGEFAGLLPKITLHAYGITVVRPLIYVEEQSIVTFAKQYGFNRITCRCPAGQKSTRKQTDGLLDVLSTVFPNARANVASASLVYGSQKARRPWFIETP
jgi:tRNA 2-thiocytidine biosynthesis protein TtcA